MKKKEKIVRQYWNDIVSLFFNFCEEKFGERPTFDGSSPRELGMIYDAIKKKSDEKQLDWTEDRALKSHRLFFEFCWADNWLQKNFILFNLNRQKDKIFFNIKNNLDGKRNSEVSGKNSGNHKTRGNEAFADRLKNKLDSLQRSGEKDS